MAWLMIAASVILVTIAQLLMKSGMGGMPLLSAHWFDWHWIYHDLLMSHLDSLVKVFFGLGCYVVSLVCWMRALATLPLSVAYPCLSISYVLVSLFAHLLFHEPLSLLMLMGSMLIILGISLITYRPVKKH